MNLNVRGDIYGRGSKCYHLLLGAQRKDLYWQDKEDPKESFRTISSIKD